MGHFSFHEYNFHLKNIMKESELKQQILVFTEIQGIMIDERNEKKNHIPNVFWGKYRNQVLS